MMKKLLAALAMTAAIASPSQAETQIYSTTGYWSNYAGTGEKGTPMCGMHTATPQAEQSIHIKWVGGSYYMFVTKDAWAGRIQNGSKIPVVIGFDGRELQAGEAYGTTERRSGRAFGMLQIGIGPTEQAAITVLDDVARAGRMTLRFPSGTEKAWTLGMVGSRAAVNNLITCVVKMSARYGIPRFAGQPEITVPFDANGNRSAPATRQPYESDI
jgi:hypothetical protein